MEQDFHIYEDIIYSIVERIFSLEFDIETTLDYNGRLFKLELVDNLAKIIFTEIENTKIVTINNPITGSTVKYISKGLTEFFGHVEAEVDANVENDKSILAFFIEQVKDGFSYDEDTVILLEEHCYELKYSYDRFANKIINITLRSNEAKGPQNKRTMRGKHLIRTK